MCLSEFMREQQQSQKNSEDINPSDKNVTEILGHILGCEALCKHTYEQKQMYAQKCV